MIRRDFLRRLALTTAGLLVADDALELLTEPRRRYWPGADFQEWKPVRLASVDAVDDDLLRVWWLNRDGVFRLSHAGPGVVRAVYA